MDRKAGATRTRERSEPRAEARLLELLRQDLEHRQPGERFPSVRELVKQHHASPVTVNRAVQGLVRDGRLVARPGSGTFVAATPGPKSTDTTWQSVTLGARALVADDLRALLEGPRPGLLGLSVGYTDESLHPTQALERAAARAARRPGVWARQPVAGLEALRAWFAGQMHGQARAQDVLVAPGGQAAVSTVLRALVAPGEAVVLESPTYFGALAVTQSAGLRTVPVPTDTNGIRVDLLEAALHASGAKVIYLQPLYANPTGSTLTAERRHELVRIARNAGAFIVEDDYGRDFQMDGDAPAPVWTLAPERTVYIRSLTKATVPSLRVAGIVALGPVMRRLQLSRLVDDFFVGGLLQEIALEFVTSTAWPKHLRSLREQMRSRRDTAVRALETHFPEAKVTSLPRGGFSLWLELPSNADDAQFAFQAALAGVHINPGRVSFPAEPPGAFLRLSIAGANEATLQEGIKRLGQVWRNMPD